MNGFHSLERTLAQWQDLLMRSGWKLVDVRDGFRALSLLNQTMVAAPN
jgi:hypothetical protein